MNFVFFVLLNIVLFLRPEELFPSIQGLRLYLAMLSLCTLVNLPGIVELLRPAAWRMHPLTPFFLAYLVLVTFSSVLVRGLGEIEPIGSLAFKNGLYFFLFLATVDTIRRFKAILGWLVAIIALTITLSVLQYHGYTDFKALEPYHEGGVDYETGEFIGSVRLRASGLFSDPNDICQILMLGSICCLARAAIARGWVLRALWLLPIGLFAYATTLTHSRGGLLAVLAGVGGIIFIRTGPRTGLLLAPLVVIGGVLAAGGRQANYEMDANDTSQHRIHLWAESFIMLFQKPLYLLTGLGSGAIADELGLVAHNSYVQAYVETGLIGGTLFASLVLMPLIVIYCLRQFPLPKSNSDERRDILQLRCYVFGILGGFACMCFSLTRNMTETSYVFLGLGAGYVSLAREMYPSWFKLDSTFLKWIAALGVIVLAFFKLFTQVMAKY
jgi:putative inorganic carbon (hco3(-)) transporter